MNENENVGFDEFENALFGDDYQYDDESGSDDVETDGTGDDNADDSAEDVVSEDSDAESDEYELSDDAETSEEEETDKSDSTDAGQVFTLKVNKEEKQVTLEEMTALAQKGADYDRVKENYSKSQQTIQDLQSKLETANKYQGALDILEAVSTKTNVSLEDLAEMLYLSVRKGAGTSEDMAREELKNAKLEKELNSFKAQKAAETKHKEETAEVRAQRELEAFKENYPDVNLTDELISKLSPDLQKGVSLSAAYRSYEREQSNARIKDLEQKLAAKQKNEKNKTSSPGSQKDSGGRRSRSDYEEFERALFG